MTASPHPASLARRHAALEHDLDHELSRPLPDFTRVKRLKLLKLQIKDRLAVYTARPLAERRR